MKLPKIALVLVLTAFLATPALAQQTVIEEGPSQADTQTPATTGITLSSMTAIPPRIELSGKPGQVIQEKIKLRNESNSSMAFETDVKDFIVNNDKGTPIVVDQKTSGRWSLSSWIRVAPDRSLIDTKETRSFSLIVNIPWDALPGGHYAMVIYRPITSNTLGQSSAQISQEVATLVYVKVEGPITEDAALLRFQTDKTLEQFGPVNFTTEIENKSDIHIAPQGKIVVENVLLGKFMTRPVRTMILEKDINIFPFASRTYANQLPGKWHFGKYRATLTANYGTQGKALEGIVYFWIVPYTVLAALLVPVLILIASLLYMARHMQKRK